MVAAIRVNALLGCFSMFAILMVFYRLPPWSSSNSLPCTEIVRQRSPCRQERQKNLLESCKRLHINKTDPAHAYTNLFVNEQAKLLVCGSQALFTTLGDYGQSLVPFSRFGSESQEEMLQKHQKILVVRHPLVLMLKQYEDKAFQRADFADYMSAEMSSREGISSVERDCLPCSVHYHHVVKYESLRADMAYLSASLGPRNADTCAVLKPPEEAFYTEVLAEYDQLSMTQLSTLLLAVSSDAMLFDYQWKMNVGGKGITVRSDGTLLKCK